MLERVSASAFAASSAFNQLFRHPFQHLTNIQSAADGQHNLEQDRRLQVPQKHSGQRRSNSCVDFLTLVADRVAVTVSSILDLETSRRSQAELKFKSAPLGLLHDLTKSMTATSELSEVLRTATLAAGQRRASPAGVSDTQAEYSVPAGITAMLWHAPRTRSQQLTKFHERRAGKQEHQGTETKAICGSNGLEARVPDKGCSQKGLNFDDEQRDDRKRETPPRRRRSAEVSGRPHRRFVRRLI
jgi:hypothetical protein